MSYATYLLKSCPFNLHVNWHNACHPTHYQKTKLYIYNYNAINLYILKHLHCVCTQINEVICLISNHFFLFALHFLFGCVNTTYNTCSQFDKVVLLISRCFYIKNTLTSLNHCSFSKMKSSQLTLDPNWNGHNL